MRRLVLVLGVAVGGCLPIYNQQRTAVVPHFAPIQTTGGAQAHRVAVGVGATTAADLVAPTLSDPNAGVALPRQQGRAQMKVAFTPSFALSAIYEAGSTTKPRTFNPSLPEPDDRVLQGRGVQAEYSVATGDPHIRVGLAVEIMHWSAPWVAKDVCIDNCAGADPVATLWGTDPVMTLGMSITPSYRAGDFTVFGGVTAKNHPTLVNEVQNYGHQPAEVREGGLAGVIAAGVAYEIEKRVEVALELSQPVLGGPISYGPTVGGWLSVGFGDIDPPQPRPRPSVIYVPAPYAPTYGPPPPAPPPPP